MSDFTQAVKFAYHCVLFMVEPDATREEAERAIDGAPKVRVGMSFAVRAAVLEKFKRDPDPVPFKDYLPSDVITNDRIDFMLDHLNSFLDDGFRDAFAWLALQPESAVLTNEVGCRREAELTDGTVLFWEPTEKQWTVAAMDSTPADFVSEHAAAVAS
jgi:hypothetical protein